MIAAAGLLLLIGIGQPVESDIAGTWAGSWTLPGSPANDLAVRIERGNKGGSDNSVVSLSGGIGFQPLSEFASRRRVVTFSAMRGEEQIRFRGRLGPDAATMAGAVLTGRSTRPGAFHLARREPIGSVAGHRVYVGGLPVSAGTLVPVTMRLLDRDGLWLGEIDLPESEVVGYPIDISQDDRDAGVALMRLPVPGGEFATLALRPGTDRMSGIWGRGQDVRVVEFVRASVPSLVGSQVPQEPFAWIDRHVEVASVGEETLHGVLSTPGESNDYPLVILVGDSGTDFNGTIEGQPLLLVLVDVLTNAGFATLRLDQAAMGFVARRRALRRWMEWVAHQEAVDHRRVAVLGHGEGGSIVARHSAAFGDGVAAVVLLAAPGLPERINDVDRVEAMLRESNASDDDVHAALEARRHFTRMAMQEVQDPTILQAAAAWRRALSTCVGSHQAEPSEADLASDLDRARDLNWLDQLRFDPRTVLPRLVGMPILAIQGDADRRFDGPRNLTALVDANRSRGGLIEPVLIPGMNHMLQPVSASGAAPQLNQITVLPAVLKRITQWLQKTIGRPHIVEESL